MMIDKADPPETNNSPGSTSAEKKRRKSMRSPSIGLALGSGMARGFAHIGVIRALKRNNIHPDIIAGTSIGALVGACYAADKMDELESWALSLSRTKVFSYLDFRLRSAGLIGGKKLEKLLRKNFGDMAIADLPYPYIAIAADIATSHEVWIRQGNIVDAMRASFALPGIFPPVELNHRHLIDGALVNPVPVSVCQSLGVRMTIAVDLNADLIGKAAKPGKNYQTITGFDLMEDKSITSRWSIKNTIAERLFGRETHGPSLFGVMVSALNIVQDRLTRSRLAGDPPDVHIKPRIGHVGLLEFERAEDMIKEGELAVEQALPEIKAAMEIFTP